jgi:hypothetical protein
MKCDLDHLIYDIRCFYPKKKKKVKTLISITQLHNMDCVPCIAPVGRITKIISWKIIQSRLHTVRYRRDTLGGRWCY